MNELNIHHDATHGIPEVTPALIEFHIRRGRRMRSEAMADGLSRAAVAIRDGVIRLARRRPVGRHLRRAH